VARLVLRVGGAGSDRNPSRPPLALVAYGVEEPPAGAPQAAMSIRPDTLREHIRRLRRWGYRLVTFGALAAAASTGEAGGLAALTFDDGFESMVTGLLPVLRGERAPATVFVVSGWMGLRHPYVPWTRILTPSEVRELHANGVEIGSHSISHSDLSRLDRAAAEEELRGSKLELENVLDAEVTVAAYPNGAACAETRAACRAAGYTAACRFRGAGTWSDPYDLPRQPIGLNTSPLALWLKRDDRYERIFQSGLARASRGAVWRARSLLG
jgi:peptidoglycan/xylan/chitin deacetylase (PgdA/CDA1 family)